MKTISWVALLIFANGLYAQEPAGPPRTNQNKFRQLYDVLPTPNVYRNAAGEPGHEYYQNRADYSMDLTLDDEQQRLYGEETITYRNESPDALAYLWVQLDQNMRAKDSDTYSTRTSSLSDSEGRVSFGMLQRMASTESYDGGFKIEWVKDAAGQPLAHTINRTMMRVDLPTPLEPGKSVDFSIKWWYNINDRMKVGGRSGMEYFEEEDNYIYTIAQFFPRMAVYNDVEGWQNKQFLGRGEFTLPFGDYEVRLTTPADHVVGATGVLANAKEVLTKAQRDRFEQAKTAEHPVMIVTPEEALEAEKSKVKETKTWVFKAENVRDFGFASSRKFIWDAVGVPFGDRTVMAMSLYPKEGNPLWEQYSTEVVAHTLRVYSKYTFDYPYPVAYSVHTNRIGMEYPMICFNGGRPEADGTYSARTKHGMISVIIHEVGHNYFPMIVNSDERQWTWMDEGLNTFLQYLTEMEWDRDYPSRRGPAYKMVDYMKGDKDFISPIMTNSESIYQFGNNAYGKPATALNILRETVLGRELFDYAFKHYSQSWMFKQPSPADFFRVMENASGTDLDWFWRGWFFTTDHVDISLDQVEWFQISSQNPTVENEIARDRQANSPEFIGDIRNRTDIEETVVERNPAMKDFYNSYDPLEVSPMAQAKYKRMLSGLSPAEVAMLEDKTNFYELSFTNVGGLVMPIVLEFTFADGTTEVQRIAAEIWRQNSEQVTKVFAFEKELVSVQLDPFLETADTETFNNAWPRKPQPTRFQLYKNNWGSRPNPMQQAQESQR
ncbi:M1 family metallopeptidase [Pontibacter sp. G13]|nr:M1 family metallopeptidase [Pontibacter sp. G13]WNJ17674.1 M1 family metallopeptidase [Pontibacter sp. G13]